MEGASLHASLIGATIGNYRVVAKLGEGGMGSVYLAEHPLIGKKVALKVLHEEHTANEDVVARFFTEAKAVNDIGHPNIVDIIDFGRVQTSVGQGFVYFIMEYLQGEAISALIQREAPLPPERALAIALQVADALAASHAKGIVHRDLKPDNIFLIERARSRDNVKVLDFGIAKLVGDQGGSKRTRTGIVMGTPAYMSPEQCEGKGLIDHRPDVYALGVVLFEMLAGRVPFVGEGYGEILVQHLTQPPPPLSQVRPGCDPALETVLLKALEKKREHRFQNMEEMLEALKNPTEYVAAHGGPRRPTAAVASASPSTAYPAQGGLQYQTGVAFQTGTGFPPPDTSRRSRTPLLIGVGLALAAGAGLGVMFLMNRKAPGPPAETQAAASTTPTEPAATSPTEATTPAANPSPPAAEKPAPAQNVTIDV